MAMRFRQVIGSLKHGRGSLIRRISLIGSCILLIYLVITSSTQAASIAVSSKGRSSQISTAGSVGRDAKDSSPFRWIENRRRKALRKAATAEGLLASFWRFFSVNANGIEDSEQQLLVNWENAPLADKCRYMIDATYTMDKGWSNHMIVDFYANEEVDDLLASLLGERLRLFDYCFIAGGLSMRKVFEIESLIDPDNKSNSSPEDFVKRVFPFLRQAGDQTSDPMWPEVIDLTSGEKEPVPELPDEFSRDFWLNWQTIAKDKGIVVTLNEASKNLFYKQLKVLEHNGNRLPIQIITSGNEFSADFRKELQETVEISSQQVYLINCSPLLDASFAKKNIVNVINKWLAVIFNTFEEAVLLDVDAVPFVPIERFLQDKSYKESGILMYKDRFMPEERTFQYCVDMLKDVEPSWQEKNLIKSKIKYRSDFTDFDESEEAAVFQRFSHDLLLHHVDSGLVVINKVRNLNGLLFSFMLNLDAKMKRCVYGDKEMFWLGQLYAGQNYSIYPVDGAIIGPVRESVEKDSAIYQICASQIAHSDESQDLLWTNGGLKTCKRNHGAELDFENDPKYFKERYGDLATLQNIYNAPLNLEGMIIPKTQERWIQLEECSGYIYCATAMEEKPVSNSQQSVSGHISIFDEPTLKKYNSVLSIWNES
ncbi:hypothetical protein HG536_0F03430 [Torulaspora globosa]|uniref:Alpha-1,3-mannosyltransferase n=1 Tax=Torulaspora globosa TaxID=48254 RepID=A0A7G3ZKI2_9SACH|nr:uncharacterized protein HG536_0F03430 [Torulaspora globosa]QLL34018.1 hypothetical protein HG536_0F03430 [Torulaspora globosa]